MLEKDKHHDEVYEVNIGFSEARKNASMDSVSFFILSPNDIEKSKLLVVRKINELIALGKLSQKDAATLLHVDQPKISQMKNNKISGFSLERLIKFLISLGWKVGIKLEKK